MRFICSMLLEVYGASHGQQLDLSLMRLRNPPASAVHEGVLAQPHESSFNQCKSCKAVALVVFVFVQWCNTDCTDCNKGAHPSSNFQKCRALNVFQSQRTHRHTDPSSK